MAVPEIEPNVLFEPANYKLEKKTRRQVPDFNRHDTGIDLSNISGSSNSCCNKDKSAFQNLNILETLEKLPKMINFNQSPHDPKAEKSSNDDRHEINHNNDDVFPENCDFPNSFWMHCKCSSSSDKNAAEDGDFFTSAGNSAKIVTSSSAKPFLSCNVCLRALINQNELLKKIKNNVYLPPAETHRINWPQMLFLLISPLVALYGVLTTKVFSKATLLFSVIYYVMAGFGITAGYHRLWAHRAYSACTPYRVFMMLAGSAAVQGSIRWWSRGHRAHHRYTDSDADPYSAHRGFLWSHILWMFFKPDSKALGTVTTSDLDASRLVRWQHRHYVPIALVMAFGVPTGVCGLFWGDWRGGFFLAGVTRCVILQHATFCINSLAHWFGSPTYDDKLTPRDHIVTAFITLGEGYHNYHHQFPNDYRNGVRSYHYDPTKWVIATCFYLGLTYDLKRTRSDLWRKGAVLMKTKQIMNEFQTLDWGIPDSQLPVWTRTNFEYELKLNPALVIVDSVVCDVSLFVAEHPGGAALLKANFGKDVTKKFKGGVYNHSTAAYNVLSKLRVAKIVDDEIEILYQE